MAHYSLSEPGVSRKLTGSEENFACLAWAFRGNVFVIKMFTSKIFACLGKPAVLLRKMFMKALINIQFQTHSTSQTLLSSSVWCNVWFKQIFSNYYWMRLSRIWRILQIEEGVIHRGRRPRWITPSEICRILHILRKPNSIIASLFIQNISPFLKEFHHFALCFSAHQI